MQKFFRAGGNHVEKEGKGVKLYTSKVISHFLGLSERRIRQLRDEEILLETRPGLYPLPESIQRYIRYLKEEAGGKALDYNQERAKLMKAKQRREEYELRRMEGDLHDSGEIRGALEQALGNFKSRLSAIPARLAPVLAKKTDPDEIFRLIKQQTDEALEELSDFSTLFEDKSEEEAP